MATVHEVFTLPDGTPYIGKVRFDLVMPPSAVVGNVVTAAPVVVVADASGGVSATLRAGLYNVTAENTRSFQINVSDDAADYAILDIVASGLTQPPAPYSGNGGGGGGGGSTPVATPTIAGKVRVNSSPVAGGDPVVYLKEETDALAGAQNTRLTAVEDTVAEHEIEIDDVVDDVSTQGALVASNTAAISTNAANITTATNTANAANSTAIAAQSTANTASATAAAAKASADAATAAAAGFPVASFLGTLTTLASDPGLASGNSGKWWQSGVAGTLTHANAGGLVVAVGDRLLSNGTVWLKYLQAPAYLPDGSVIRAKLEPILRDALTIADGYANQLWGVQDKDGRLALWIGPAGRIYGHLALQTGITNGLSVSWDAASGYSTLNLGTVEGSLPVGPTVLQSMPEFQGWYFAVLDRNGRMGLGIDTAGKVTARIAEIADARGPWPTLSDKLAQSLTTYGLLKTERWGNWFLRNWRLKLRNKLDGLASEMSVALIGDSWTTYGYTLYTARKLIAAYGDAGAGWVGFASATIFGQPATAALGSVDPAVVTVTRSGTWADLIYTGQGPDTCAASSTVVGSRINLNLHTGATSYVLHYQVKAGYGVLRVRFDGGAWNSVDCNTTGAARYATLELQPFAAGNTGPSICDIEVESGTVAIFGVHIRRGTNGARISQVAVGGNRSDFLLNATAPESYAELKPDLFSVLLATNDMFDYTNTTYPAKPPALTPAQFRDNLIAYAAKLRAAVPLCDVLFICAAQTVRLGPNGETIDDYADAMLEAAARSKAAFINLRKLFGDYADYAPPGTGLDLYKDTLHPNDARGMRLVEDAVWQMLVP